LQEAADPVSTIFLADGRLETVEVPGNLRIMQRVCTMLDTAIAPMTRRGPQQFPAEAAETLSLENAADPVAKTAARLLPDEAVGRALRATGYLALRDIQVEIDRGIAMLRGRVPTYHQKQLAQAVAQKVNGVRGIANGIEVVCRR
jgi:hypothetical protein